MNWKLWKHKKSDQSILCGDMGIIIHVILDITTINEWFCMTAFKYDL